MQCQMYTDTLLMQFAKTPESGRVKTRLAKTMGDDLALRIHCRLVLDTLLAIQGRWPQQLWWSSHPDSLVRPVPGCVEATLSELDTLCIRYNIGRFTQQGADLGQRMAHALISGDRQQGNRVILAGSDCPVLDENYIESAFRALEKSSYVLGPAEDGGYVLVGINRRLVSDAVVQAVFSEVNWGTGEVLEKTLDNIRNAGLDYQLLPELWDVDEEADWRRFQKQASVVLF
ncbi:MAG: hypothetical protein CSB48_10170 [Proteobacteria bacterium]|nr:MAG: hypothetical protein CSB48_10170 [Pseudomonadota bacterium]